MFREPAIVPFLNTLSPSPFRSSAMFKALSNRPLTALFTLYWALFWLLNGLDKFCCREDFSLFYWYGNDRHEKFGMYFERLGLSPDWVSPVLTFAGIWEVAIAVPLITAVLAVTVKGLNWAEEADDYLVTGTALGILTMIGFSIFDVIVGDRAELWEHGTYVALIGVSYIVAQVEQAILLQADETAVKEPVTEPAVINPSGAYRQRLAAFSGRT